MISVDVTSRPRVLTVQNHGESHVCAAVSLLVINTINAIEKFTGADFKTDYQENGGFIRFELTGKAKHDVKLLWDTLMLGLKSVYEKYPDEIKITERK